MSNLVKNSLYGAVVLLALYGVYALVQPSGAGDRPPILVADGSLDIHLQPDADTNKGQFTDTEGNKKKKWRHDHKNPKPQWFTVLFVGGVTGCPDLEPYWKINEIRVNPNADPTIASALTISVKDGAAEFDFKDDAALSTDRTSLTLGSGSVNHVELFRTVGGQLTKIASCDPLIPPSPTTKSSLKFIVFQSQK